MLSFEEQLHRLEQRQIVDDPSCDTLEDDLNQLIEAVVSGQEPERFAERVAAQRKRIEEFRIAYGSEQELKRQQDNQ